MFSDLIKVLLWELYGKNLRLSYITIFTVKSVAFCLFTVFMNKL